MGAGTIVAVNGLELPAYVVELGGGYRVRFCIDDWERLQLYRGQRVPVRLPGRDGVWLYLSEVVEVPPVAWVVLVQRLWDRAG